MEDEIKNALELIDAEIENHRKPAEDEAGRKLSKVEIFCCSSREILDKTNELLNEEELFKPILRRAAIRRLKHIQENEDFVLFRATFTAVGLWFLEGANSFMFDEVLKAELSRKEGAKKGGENRTDEQQQNYNTHEEWWNKWQKNPALFKNKTAYDEAMRDKTGASDRTIRIHRKKFETGNK